MLRCQRPISVQVQAPRLLQAVAMGVAKANAPFLKTFLGVILAGRHLLLQASLCC